MGLYSQLPLAEYTITQRQVQDSGRSEYYILCAARSCRVLHRVFRLPVPGRRGGRGRCNDEVGLFKVRLYETGEDSWEQEYRGTNGDVGTNIRGSAHEKNTRDVPGDV